MTTSVVTGGAGFIGGHLVRHLLAAGDDVTVLDDLSTGSETNVPAPAIGHRIRLVRGSVLDRATVESVVRGADRVFHLAAAVGVRLIVDNPLDCLRVNIHGTESVLDAAHRAGARVLLVSSSEVYGKNEADLLHEDSDRILGSSLKSRWSYAAAKGIDEAVAHAYWRQRGLQVTIARPFNTVGPGQTGRYGMVLPTFVGQALADQDVTVHGTGEQTRCFTDVRDVVPALVALIEHPRSAGSAFNLGGGIETSINCLAARVIELVGSLSKVVHVPYDEAYGEGYEDMLRRVPDCTRARDLVGFKAGTSLDEIIRRVTDDARTLRPRTAGMSAFSQSLRAANGHL